jgi:DNA-binding NarL/FixJ family response regulator
MVVDRDVLSALKQTISALSEEQHRPVPVGSLAPLVKIARPGLRLRLDIEASREIGAPLITIAEERDRAALLSVLTKRQQQVAELVIEGLSNRTIASRLGISVATVKDHVHAILERLALPSRVALIAASNS